MTTKESYVLLDGESVPASMVDPKRHRFLGMWRPPKDPLAKLQEENLRQPPEERWDVFHCSCGKAVWYVDHGEHWKSGCFDAPQYRSITGMDHMKDTDETLRRIQRLLDQLREDIEEVEAEEAIAKTFAAHNRRWTITDELKRRMMNAGLGDEPPLTDTIYREPQPPIGAYLKFNGVQFDPARKRVGLLLDGKEIAHIDAPVVTDGNTLTVQGQMYGFIPLTLE